MEMNRFAPAGLFATALLVLATPAWADNCVAGKLKTSGKALSAALKCDEKAERDGTAGGGAACKSRHVDVLPNGFAKADGKGPCAGTAANMQSVLDICEGNVLAAVGASATSPAASTCDAKKVSAMAKKASAKLRCLAKQARS